MLAALVPKNQAWARQAPVLVLVSVRLTLERNETVNPLAWYDAGQAVALMTLQATSQSLAIRQMAGFDSEKARLGCAIPAPFELGETVFEGAWGQPIDT